MKKIVMTLAILVMAGAAFLAVQNRNSLIAEKQLLTEVQSDVTEKRGEVNQAEDDREDARVKKTAAEDARNQVTAQLAEAQQSLRRKEDQKKKAEEELEIKEIQIKEINLAIESLNLGEDVKDFETLQKREQALKDQLTETQNRKTELASQMESVGAEATAAEKKAKELEQYQVERAKQIALNGLEATVIAVNQQWGFVMVNAGKNLGVNADSSLLVKRGQERIARLRIVSLEPDVLVADVIPESLAEGERVKAGDKVIFENTK